MSHSSAADVVLRGVAKRYGSVTAVKPLDLTIAAGTLAAVHATADAEL